MQEIEKYLKRLDIVFEQSEDNVKLPCLNFNYNGLMYQVIYTENFVEGHLTVRVVGYNGTPFVTERVEVCATMTPDDVASYVREVNLDIEYNFTTEDPTVDLDIVLNNDDKDNLDMIFSLKDSKYNKLCAAIFQSI